MRLRKFHQLMSFKNKKFIRKGDLLIYKSDYAFWTGLVVNTKKGSNKDTLIIWENGNIEWLESSSFEAISDKKLTHITL